MAEWGTTPDYITANWTDEMLYLMLEKLTERKERESRIMGEARERHSPKMEKQEVPPEMLFAMMGKNVEVVKDGHKNR